MIKQNKVLLEETQLDYIGTIDEVEYEKLELFLEALYIEGICDEAELQAYENIKLYGHCPSEEYEYVIESIETWNEDEYFRRLDEISNY